jgi:hypothetical protein
MRELGFAAAGNGDQCRFIVSWTVGGPFSLAFHLKPVGAERPDWHAAELLITAFSRFYGAGDIFRATNLNALLKNARWMPVRADWFSSIFV